MSAAKRPCAGEGCRKNASTHFCCACYLKSIAHIDRECATCGWPIKRDNITGFCFTHYRQAIVSRVPAKARMRARELALQDHAPVAFVDPDEARIGNCYRGIHSTPILARISAELSVDPEHVIGHDRSQIFVDARAVTVIAMRRRGASYPAIGLALGGRDHTSAIHLARTFGARCLRRPWLAAIVERVAA